MILIADCGSTKVDWCLVDDGTGRVVKQVFTPGMNAVILPAADMAALISSELVPQLGELNSEVESIYFYGAGCISPEVCGNVADALRSCIPASTIEVHTDLLAAARALCGSEPGIACILGTGSNSCYYDGTAIVDNVSPLGYILGDEGSGAVLGKLLVGDVLKNQLPPHICEKFLTETGLDRLTIIRRVYKEAAPNRFLASLSPFLKQNIDVPEIKALVIGAFRAFFIRNVMQYPQHKELAVNFVGSIAHYYKEELAEAAASCRCRLGRVIKSPMEGLIAYHS